MFTIKEINLRQIILIDINILTNAEVVFFIQNVLNEQPLKLINDKLKFSSNIFISFKY